MIAGKLDHVVAFHVSNTQTHIHVVANGIIPFNHVITNIGQAFDTLTGVFTCPVSGLYDFQVSVFVCLSLSMFVCLSLCISLCLSLCLSASLFVCLSISLSPSRSLPLILCLSLSMTFGSVSRSVSLCLYLSFSVFHSLYNILALRDTSCLFRLAL